MSYCKIYTSCSKVGDLWKDVDIYYIAGVCLNERDIKNAKEHIKTLRVKYTYSYESWKLRAAEGIACIKGGKIDYILLLNVIK